MDRLLTNFSHFYLLRIMNVILERHFVCGTVHEDRLCDCGIAVQDEEHVLPIVS